ncbi:hypothetical protein HYS99_01490 [Candidatus Giovannonibacteria bacterium]|nr:hypothetical protein [Candidatus Giovannonibacteria bacterium]
MLAQNQNERKSISQKILDWWNAHFYEIAMFSIIFLTILALFGLFRLWQVTPKKEPIRIEASKNQ